METPALHIPSLCNNMFTSIDADTLKMRDKNKIRDIQKVRDTHLHGHRWMHTWIQTHMNAWRHTHAQYKAQEHHFVVAKAYLAVRLGAAGELTVPVGSKLHGLVHVVFILFRGQHQLHVWVNAAVALVGTAPDNLLAVHTSWGGPCLAHRACQGEVQLTAQSHSMSQHIYIRKSKNMRE